MSEVLEEIGSQIEAVEEVLSVEAIARKINPRTLLVITGAFAALGGAAAGYLIATKLLASKFQEMADAQVEDVKNRYALINKDGLDLDEMAAKYHQADSEETIDVIVREGYRAYNEIETPPATESQLKQQAGAPPKEHQNIFATEDRFDLAREEARRTEYPDKPYILTAAEFNDGDNEYEQMQVTYYEGDGVLADVNDQPVEDPDGTVGVENFLRFGHGSGEPNVVYIRNEPLRADIEMVRAGGKYSVDVLGLDDVEDTAELRHSDRSVRRMRFRDE